MHCRFVAMTVIMSLVGMVVLVGIAFAASHNRKAIQLRTVLGAFAIQLFFGAFVLYIPSGKSLLIAISSGVQRVIDYETMASPSFSEASTPTRCLKSSVDLGLSLPFACFRSSFSSRP